MIERTKGRTKAEVTSTGISPWRAASSKRSRTWMTKSCSLEGCMARWRSSPWPTIDSAKAVSQLGDSVMMRQLALRRRVLRADLAGEALAHDLGDVARVLA